MSYTRLTGKADNGKPYFDGCLLCDLKSDCGLCPYWESGINRLAELEDMLDDGELVSKEWHDEQVMHYIDENNELRAENERLTKRIEIAVKDRTKEILQKVRSYTLDKEVGMKYLLGKLEKEYGIENNSDGGVESNAKNK